MSSCFNIFSNDQCRFLSLTLSLVLWQVAGRANKPRFHNLRLQALSHDHLCVGASNLFILFILKIVQLNITENICELFYICLEALRCLPHGLLPRKVRPMWHTIFKLLDQSVFLTQNELIKFLQSGRILTNIVAETVMKRRSDGWHFL